ADISLHQPDVRLTHFAQIAITGKDNAFFRRQWIVPWRFARDRSNAFMELALVYERRVRIEPGELVKLLDGPGHDETAAGIAGRVFPLKEIVVRKDFFLFVCKYCCCFEIEGV